MELHVPVAQPLDESTWPPCGGTGKDEGECHLGAETLVCEDILVQHTAVVQDQVQVPDAEGALVLDRAVKAEQWDDDDRNPL